VEARRFWAESGASSAGEAVGAIPPLIFLSTTDGAGGGNMLPAGEFFYTRAPFTVVPCCILVAPTLPRQDLCERPPRACVREYQA
jgi:hypothetical protein